MGRVQSSLMTRGLKRIIRLRPLLAIALMFWCAGTGCMMVSYARAATSDAGMSAQEMAQARGSMAMDAHACCKARRSSHKASRQRTGFQVLSADLNLLTTPSMPAKTGAMNCCPLTSGSIVGSSRSQSGQNTTLAQQVSSSSLFSVESTPSPLSVPLRLPDRAHSYLLDCAFLI